MSLFRIQVLKLICLNAVFGGAALLGACVSDARMQEAEVRQVLGVPCFAVGGKGAFLGNSAPRLAALEVSDYAAVPAKKVWSFAYPAGLPQRLPGDTCILYGVVPAGATQSDRGKELLPGKIYEVYLNASFEDPKNPIFGFVKKFCLKAEANGKTKVVQVAYIEGEGWDLHVCR